MFVSILVLEELVGRDHRDAIPRADLMAERAADAAGQVDGADLKSRFMAWAGDRADAIDRTDGHTRFAAGAHVLVEKGQNFGEFLLRHRHLIVGYRPSEFQPQAAGKEKRTQRRKDAKN